MSWDTMNNFTDPRLWILLLLGYEFLRHRHLRIEKWLAPHFAPLRITIVLFVFGGIYKWLQWKAALPSGSDFGHYDYAIWNASQGRDLIVTIMKPQYYSTLMGNHFAPFLYLFAPLHWIKESHFWLMLAQAFAWSSSFFLAYRYAEHKFSSWEFPASKTLALFLSFALVLSNHFLRVFKFEFHPEVFLVPLSLWLLYTFEREKWIQFTLALFLCLSLKEDSALYLFSLFLAQIFLSKEGQRKRAITLALAMPIAFALSLSAMKNWVVDPSQSSFMGLWGRYGSNMREVAINILTHPHWVIGDIFGSKEFYKLLLPWLFLPFLGFQALGLVVPAVISFTSEGVIKSLSIYYSAPFLGVLLWGTVWSGKTLQKFKMHFLKIGFVVFALQCLIGIGSFTFPKSDGNVEVQKQKIEALLHTLEKNQDILWLSDQLIAQVPYSLIIRRFSEHKDQNGWLFISKKIFGHPLSRDEQLQRLAAYAHNPLYEKVEETEDWAIFHKKISGTEVAGAKLEADTL